MLVLRDLNQNWGKKKIQFTIRGDSPTKLGIGMDADGCENQSIRLDSNKFYKTYNVLSM